MIIHKQPFVKSIKALPGDFLLIRIGGVSVTIVIKEKQSFDTGIIVQYDDGTYGIFVGRLI